ncbi:hypothetical protein BUALT_Bualt13G0041700 [Buddleja alternifolia]|uniref:NAC domain-containing protein n=1 Tax=Buddleja alternifolia TaxID=168488 RepID=A0AAV6WKC1_9LAMI|nr:hypothetical protein BUALT_Bualt13G0041700 [Buddleja alternifolia]
MASNQIPIGYRFLPNDDELITHYLKEKIRNETFRFDYIHDANVYEFNPQTLTGKFLRFFVSLFIFLIGCSIMLEKMSITFSHQGVASIGMEIALIEKQDRAIGRPPEQINPFITIVEKLLGSRNHWSFMKASLQIIPRLIGSCMNTVDQPTRNRRNEDNMRLDDWVLCGIHLEPQTEEN